MVLMLVCSGYVAREQTEYNEMANKVTPNRHTDIQNLPDTAASNTRVTPQVKQYIHRLTEDSF